MDTVGATPSLRLTGMRRGRRVFRQRIPCGRPRFDELGLRRALADRMLPFLVAAMAFLAALALAGWVGAAALARHWQEGAGAALTVQVPQPGEPAAQGGGHAGWSACWRCCAARPASPRPTR